MMRLYGICWVYTPSESIPHTFTLNMLQQEPKCNARGPLFGGRIFFMSFHFSTHWSKNVLQAQFSDRDCGSLASFSCQIHLKVVFVRSVERLTSQMQGNRWHFARF
ncbi:hypothetical protein XU18_4184 [Perkinsela sp. CCAP 1560/4]|nr:hypothetical protein XU18_4184 [Perkinsela sp. CCAP 1560/4]|eukprot:KNH04616.1 hypothetical protein XU18_4184 [Perkinsela sp. CCAP 1560/4]